jgi:hypothetical protein
VKVYEVRETVDEEDKLVAIFLAGQCNSWMPLYNSGLIARIAFREKDGQASRIKQRLYSEKKCCKLICILLWLDELTTNLSKFQIVHLLITFYFYLSLSLSLSFLYCIILR